MNGYLNKNKRTVLIWVAAALFAIKCLEFILDPHVFFDSDSGSFLLNGLSLGFIPVRSYVYGDIIVRFIAVPFHDSLRAVVAAQCLMGGVTAWFLCYCLISFFAIRKWIAIICALIFALDPVQIFHEHLILTESMTMVVAALFITTALRYLKYRHWVALVGTSILGAALVGLRVVYVPVVLAAAVVIPLIAWLPGRERERWVRRVALALVVSCGSTLSLQAGYRDLTGHLARREPGYHYWTGCFLLASVSPLVEPTDSNDPRLVSVIAESKQSRYPLEFHFRVFQLWSAGGLIDRLKTALQGDDRLTNSAAEAIARNAIRRNPAGFLRLGLRTYFAYWADLLNLGNIIHFQLNNVVSSSDRSLIAQFFHIQAVPPGEQRSASVRYYFATRFWYGVLLFSPALLIMGFFLRSTNRQEMLFLFTWTVLLLIATCLGAVESNIRYLHPFAFGTFAGFGVIIECVMGRTPQNAEHPVRFALSSG